MNSLARTARWLRSLVALGIVSGLPSAALAQVPNVAGSAGFELRGFPYESITGLPAETSMSAVLRPELEWDWDDGDQRLRFLPFGRIDQADAQRTHFDVRELIWMKRGETWEIAAGIGRVFWGVTESQHLVDIVNQTDLVENLDGEDKLGQPMVNVTLLRGWGALDLFVLPGFRERPFPGVDGRFRPPTPVDGDGALYESGAENRHVDVALRWSHYIGDWDVGLAHFHGTGREPALLPLEVAALVEAGAIDLAAALVAGEPSSDATLVPFYSIIDQTSLDLAGVKGDMLWKMEVINRFGQGDRYAALTGGLEYTIIGALGSAWDVGLLAEYLWDERGGAALTPFEDDVFLGARLALNDIQSTDLLAGLIIDRHSGASLVSIELNRRIRDRYTLEVEGRFFLGARPPERLYFFQADDYVSIAISRYF